MRNEFPKKSRGGSRIGFLLYPITFLLLGSLFFYVAFAPILKPALGAMDMFFLKKAPDFDWEAADIYKEKQHLALPETNDMIEISGEDYPLKGQRYGQVVITSADIDAPLYYGDSSTELSKGVGSFTRAYIPGAGRTIILSAHNNTYFHTLGEVRVGDTIQINTNYGKYAYEVTEMKIVLNTDGTAYDLQKQEENLLLYTCYPFDTLGLTPNRYLVYAKYVSGPQLDLAF
jgi:sortase A